jgi:1-deoxy-D-xylulose-5-phosphate reductoisomerase
MAQVRVAVGGSSGSIGTQTLDVVRAESEQFRVTALSVHSSSDVLIEQAKEFRPDLVVVTNPAEIDRVASALPGVTVSSNITDLVEAADVVVNAVVGFAGLPLTEATLRAGKRLALANKESLIAAGPVVQPLRKTPGAELVPVDSEHCALHQCLRASTNVDREVGRLILTASGGPFRGRTRSNLAGVSIADALAHPTWSMGPKITIDSSTLMNKGLEVIEAHVLFNVDYKNIEVVVHPQSIVHSMVEFSDGSTIAQLSMPDMRLPIGYALGYPNRIRTPFGAINWQQLSQLDFVSPDTETFRCLSIAYEAGRIGGTAPAWISAANEVAVEAFLNGQIEWLQIADVIEATLERHDGSIPSQVADIVEADRKARAEACTVLRSK